MKVIRSLPEADQEYDDALAASVEPDAFRQEVNDALNAIARGIIVHRTIGRSGNIRECMLSRLPYSIVYRDEPDTIRIVAFPHKKRRRGYWKSRVKKS
jgi:plasmid stabilization system protein ParE